MGESVSALIELLFTSHDGITLGHYEEGAIHSMGVGVAGVGLGQGADSVGIGFGGFAEWQTDRIFLEGRCVVSLDHGRSGTAVDAASSSGSSTSLVAGRQADCLCQ